MIVPKEYFDQTIKYIKDKTNLDLKNKHHLILTMTTVVFGTMFLTKVIKK